MSNTLKEETGRVLLAGVAVWATVVSAAAVEGLFGKFEAGSIFAFAGAVSAYSLAAYRIDPNLRGYASQVGTRWVLGALALALGVLVAAALAGLQALVVFSAPLATLTLAAALEGGARAKPRKARAKSPGATPAAT